jgi:DNA mismatch endonuclease, patch repair protein
MKVALNPETETRIRNAVKPGDPWALDEFPKERVAVFVDGGFWHGCPMHCRMPKGNRAYWNQKISSNEIRDRHVTQALRKRGWRVLRIWEHELAKKYEPKLVRRVQRALD